MADHGSVGVGAIDPASESRTSIADPKPNRQNQNSKPHNRRSASGGLNRNPAYRQPAKRVQPLAPAHPHPLNLNLPMQDRYGLPITTGSSRAADLFVDGLDILLSMNHGAPERIAQAIEADDSFAVAHATLAYRFMFEGKVKDARKSIKRAAARAEGLTRRERLYVAVIHAYIHSPGHEALSLMKEYLREFPRDILILYIANNLLFYGCSGGGSKSFPADQMALCGEVASHYGDDWAFQSRYAFAHHESGILDESLRLAEASLKTRP